MTCMYGGILCCLGFLLVGLGVTAPSGPLVVAGLGLAGQGSKGLGFGTLLGTIRNSPENKSSMISGVYLMLDACSAIICIFVYDGIKAATGYDSLEEDQKV